MLSTTRTPAAAGPTINRTAMASPHRFIFGALRVAPPFEKRPAHECDQPATGRVQGCPPLVVFPNCQTAVVKAHVGGGCRVVDSQLHAPRPDKSQIGVSRIHSKPGQNFAHECARVSNHVLITEVACFTV